MENNEEEITRECRPLVPKLNGPTFDGGYIYASTQQETGYNGWEAFSNVEERGWSTFPYNGLNQYIICYFDEPISINKIEMKCMGTSIINGVIKDFTIYGSNDGNNYETIYKGKHENNFNLETFELKSYSKKYNYIKLVIDSVWQEGAIVLEKLQYYGY